MNTQTPHTTKYKNSPLGLIPEEWESCSVEFLVNEGIIEKPLDGNHGNIHPTSEDFVANGIPFIMANNVHDGILDLSNCYYIKKTQADSLQKGFSFKGDVLLTHKGTVGNVAIVGDILTDYIMLTPQVTYYRIKNHQKLNRKYLKSYFEGEAFRSILKVQSGGGTRAYIGITNQRKLPIIMPRLPEQKAIADCLSTWDIAIEKQTALIAQKELSKKALMQQLLSGKKRLKGFGGEWKEVRLGKVCNLVNGMAFKPNEWTNSGIPIIRIQNLNGSDDFNYCDGEIQSRYLVNHGDLLFAWSGSRGTSFGAFRWFKNKAVLNQHIFNVFPKNGFEKDFAFQLLRWLTIGIERKAHGSAGLVHVTKKQLEDEKMNIPNNKEEQAAIADVLQCADTEIQLLQHKLTQLKEQKKGLMQILLTGKKRLKY